MTIDAAIDTGTSHGGSRNRTGTSASCTGDVQASGRSKRATWPSEIIAMLSRTSIGSAPSGASR